MLEYNSTTQEYVGTPTMSRPKPKDKPTKGSKKSCKRKAEAEPNDELPLATHAMSIMLCGLTKRWKNIVGYHFTDNSFCPVECKDFIFEVVRKATDIGLIVKCIIMDNSTQNLRVQEELGVSVEKSEDACETCNTFLVPGVEEPIGVFVDPPHILKSQRNALFNNGEFVLDDYYVNEANLEYNKVEFKWIEKLVEFQAERQLLIAPHLSQKDIDLGNYAKMKVNLAVHVLSRETATALEFCVKHYPDHFPQEALTTAWFCGKVGKYWSIVSCRGSKQALSLAQPDKYKEAIDYMQWFMGMYVSTKLGPTHQGGLLPTQRGIIMSTTSYIWLANYMLKQPGVKFFKCGLVSNDPIESFHGCARAKNPKPTCLQFMRILKAICMCQVLEGPEYGSYESDECTNYLTDLKGFKAAQELAEQERVAKMAAENNNAAGEDFVQEQEDAEFANLLVEADVAEVNALAYLTGYLLYKTIVSSQSKCKTCQEHFVGDENDDQLWNELIRMKDYRIGALCRPTELANKMVKRAENLFRAEQDNLKHQKKTRLGDRMTSKLLLQWRTHFSDAPKCHLKLLATRFAKIRLHFYGVYLTKNLVTKQKKKLAKESRGSKSTADLYAENMK